MISKTAIRTPIWVLYTALFIALLPIGSIPLEMHSLVNRAMVILALFTWLVGVIMGRFRITWTTTTSLMLIFLLWSTFTGIWANNLDGASTTLLMYVSRLILCLLLIPSLIRTQKDLDGLMKTLALSGWVLILVSMGVVLVEGYVAGARLQVLQTNSNGLGMFALLTMTGVLWQVLHSSGRGLWIKRMLASIFILMMIIVVALSGSRGSAISMGIAVVAFMLWKPARSWGKVILLAAGIMAVSAPFIFDTLLARFAVTTGDTPLGGREVLWQAGWRLISDVSLLGVGIGNCGFDIQPYLSISTSNRVSLHNPVLVVWSETGIVGIVLYLSFLLSAVISFWKQYQRCKRDGVEWLIPYFAVVGPVFLGYMASWIKGGGAETEISFFLMLALLLVPSSLNIEGMDSLAGRKVQRVHRSERTIAGVAAQG